ncbi:MAG TPA: right-handed parallel beta-helix repeat-containing protein [Pyrinomonadaceae bacterium]|nr:right-handed parallel beta-helix repeat-containing protein [Pyrinomonadaceae bacterium]
MNKLRITLNLLGSLVFILALTTLAHAQATRTWVSGVGDDANPCSRTAPCKTFAGAISKTANGGEIDALDPGGYGAVTITKGITIDGNGTLASILFSGTNGVVVNATANDIIILRNLTLNGAGTTLGVDAIRYLAGKELHVENCRIQRYSDDGIDVRLSTLVQSTGFLKVTDTIISDGGNTSIAIEPSNGEPTLSAIIEKSQLTNAQFGVYAAGGSRVSIRDSVVANHSIIGLTPEVASGNSQMTAENNLIINNATGVRAGTGATFTRLSNNTIYNNGTGISVNGGTCNSFGTNKVQGNTANNIVGTCTVVGMN